MKTEIKIIIALVFISVALLCITIFWAIEFSSFSVGITKYTISIMLVWLVDKFVITEVDTLKLIGKNPIAYAIFFLGNCILAASCIASS